MNRRFRNLIWAILMAISSVTILIGIGNSISAINHEKKVMDTLHFVDEIGNDRVSFTAWEAVEEEMYYLVLPSAYLQRDFEVQLNYEDRFYSFYIDDMKYKNGASWKDGLKEDVHIIKIIDLFGRVHMEKPFQILVSEDVPSVMVTVEAKEELFIEEEYSNKRYVEKGDILFLGENGDVYFKESMERFKVRGNLTATFEKKPFTFTLPQSVSLFDMSESKNWHLLANAMDGSHIRNKIMLEWAEELKDEYQPNGEYVDLFINGEYQGLYLLTETIEVSESRLKIEPSNSMLLEMELYERALEEENYVETQKAHYWVVHSENVMPENTLEEIEVYLDDIESALYSADGISELSGRKLNQMLDFDSWTDSWLLKELSSDHDLGTTSQFAVIKDWENRSVLMTGPEWDFDGTFGNGMPPWSNNPRNLVTAIPNTKGIESVSQNRWMSQMYQHEEFKELLIQKFEQEIQPKVARLLNEEIDAYAEAIQRPALLDSLRWNGNGINRYSEVPEGYAYMEAKDYHKYDVLDQHVGLIKDFLYEKEQFLEELWVEGVEFEVIVEEHNEDGMNLNINNDIYTWVKKEKIE